jgi:hypothetical protein
MRWRMLALLLLLALGSCGPRNTGQRPTLAPVIDLTPLPTQDVAGTATIYAEMMIPTATPPGLYMIRQGDTLETIARAFNTTVEALTSTNHISDANTIFVGQPLIIPSLISDTETLDPAEPGEAVESPTPEP